MSWKAITVAEGKRLQQFEHFNKRFLGCKPSRLALGKLDYSCSGDLEKVGKYLRAAYPKRPRTPSPRPPLPPHLIRLIELQSDDGKWEPSEVIFPLIGGNIPDAPNLSLAGWRWTTALVLVFLRRECAQYLHVNQLQDSYTIARSWLDDATVEQARNALPPSNIYFPLDADLVRCGMWRECEQLNIDTKGHQAFVPDEMVLKYREQIMNLESDSSSLQSNMSGLSSEVFTGGETENVTLSSQAGATESVDSSNIISMIKKGMRTPAQKAKEEAMKVENSQKRIKEKKEEEWKQRMLGYEFKKLAKISSDQKDAENRRWRDLSRVSKLWQTPIRIGKEIQRLRKLEEWKKQPKGIEWQQTQPTYDFQSTKAIPMVDLSMVKKTRFNNKEVPKVEPLRMKHKQQTPDSVETIQSSPVREQAQAQIVTKILAMEEYIKDVKAALARCTQSYRVARTHSQRLKAFDELTAMLGHEQLARKGFNDWRSAHIKGMHVMICEVVESITHWRSIIDMERAPPSQDPPLAVRIGPKVELKPLPFIWQGENILLQLPSIMEFLSSCPELVSHYGEGFDFYRNPFLRATVLDERAQTPRIATRRVMIDGQFFDEVVENFLTLRLQDEENLKQMNQKLMEAGFWWPGYGAGPKHVERIRAAEKLILAEEKLRAKELESSSVPLAREKILTKLKRN